MDRNYHRDSWAEASYDGNRRFRQLIPAEPGWRTWHAFGGLTLDEVEKAAMNDLIYTRAVIAWQLDEVLDTAHIIANGKSYRDGHAIYTSLRPVVAPSNDDEWVEAIDDSQFDGLIAPGGSLDEQHVRAAARRAAKKDD